MERIGGKEVVRKKERNSKGTYKISLNEKYNLSIINISLLILPKAWNYSMLSVNVHIFLLFSMKFLMRGLPVFNSAT